MTEVEIAYEKSPIKSVTAKNDGSGRSITASFNKPHDDDSYVKLEIATGETDNGMMNNSAIHSASTSPNGLSINISQEAALELSQNLHDMVMHRLSRKQR